MALQTKHHQASSVVAARKDGSHTEETQIYEFRSELQVPHQNCQLWFYGNVLKIQITDSSRRGLKALHRLSHIKSRKIKQYLHVKVTVGTVCLTWMQLNTIHDLNVTENVCLNLLS